MLTKLFGHRATKEFAHHCKKQAAAPAPPPPQDDPPCMPLRIIHAGGFTECYYMAVPASAIIEKHPRAMLARPEVFHQPWESLVRPDEILTPGEKFYIVPCHTISKLRQRIQRPMVYSGSRSSEPTGGGPVATASMKPERKMMMQTQGNIVKGSAPARPAERRRVQVTEMWQPSLTIIDEASPHNAPPPPLQVLPPPLQLLSPPLQLLR